MSASHVVQVSKGFAWLKASQIAVSLAGVGVAAYIETRVIEAGPLLYINPILTIVGVRTLRLNIIDQCSSDQDLYANAHGHSRPS